MHELPLHPIYVLDQVLFQVQQALDQVGAGNQVPIRRFFEVSQSALELDVWYETSSVSFLGKDSYKYIDARGRTPY